MNWIILIIHTDKAGGAKIISDTACQEFERMIAAYGTAKRGVLLLQALVLLGLNIVHVERASAIDVAPMGLEPIEYLLGRGMNRVGAFSFLYEDLGIRATVAFEDTLLFLLEVRHPRTSSREPNALTLSSNANAFSHHVANGKSLVVV